MVIDALINNAFDCNHTNHQALSCGTPPGSHFLLQTVMNARHHQKRPGGVSAPVF
jgi:hypothetical protein